MKINSLSKYNLLFLVVNSFCQGTLSLVNAQSTETSRIIVEDGWIEKMNHHFGFNFSFRTNC